MPAALSIAIAVLGALANSGPALTSMLNDVDAITAEVGKLFPNLSTTEVTSLVGKVQADITMLTGDASSIESELGGFLPTIVGFLSKL